MRPYRGFADLIRMRRKTLGLRLDQVADKVGWSIPYLSELERGVKQPPTPNQALVVLASALGLPPDRVAEEAMKSRRSVEIDLEGAGPVQRQLAVILARRFESGLSDEQAGKLAQWLSDFEEVVDEGGQAG